MTRPPAALLAVALLAAACAADSTTVQPPATSSTVPSTTTTMAARSVGEATPSSTAQATAAVRTGAERIVEEAFAPWEGQRIGLIVHTNSIVDGRHLADLVAESERVELAALFGPEHGVRGTAGAGELVADDVDPTTGVPIHSLYGETRQPTAEMLDGIDLLVYDLQDVGARWFTYIATLGLAMQAAADHDLPFVVLERPNPLGRTPTPGAVRSPDIDSFVAPYPIAGLYGLTSAELAQAIVGEAWIDGLDQLDLRIVAMDGWDPTDRWPDLDQEWIAPSPSLTTVEAGLLYPATVLFEATTLDLGRGTGQAFTRFGAPGMDADRIVARLEAAALPGVRFRAIDYESASEPYAGQAIRAVQIDLIDHRMVDPGPLGIHLLHTVLDVMGPEVLDRPEFLDLLAGDSRLRTALFDGQTPAEIIASQTAEGEAFRLLVEPYLLH